jgi:phospholipid-translocating ATPase
MGKQHSGRESVDKWLRDREDDPFPRRSSSYYTPKQSFQLPTGRASNLQQMVQDIPESKSNSSSRLVSDPEQLLSEDIAISDEATFEHCFAHLDEFATEGLRTLMYGYRIVPEDEYRKWQVMYAEASTSLDNRQEKMESIGEEIESNLELLGATAIEDKLQEGVPDAIDRFRRAGIKLWMLTGDKRETAINIGYSCRLVKAYSTVVVLDAEQGTIRDDIDQALGTMKSGDIAHSVLVVDGHTLTFIENDAELSLRFTDIAISADSVICCRASPSQKASLVRTIRTKVKGSVTLAIGDGANDIAMIQEAHVGIGIAGKEGLQAARTSDYSIGQFRFLLKLLLVHGRWNYVRICKYTLGTFWKEMLFYLVQAMYQRYNGWTGTSLYEPWSLSMFNTLFTSLPVIFMGVFEKDLAASTLLAVPELYSFGRMARGFSFAIYVWWAAMGAIEAVIVYFIMFCVYGEAIFTRDNRLFAMGCLAYSICVIVISTKLQAIELHNKSVAALIAIVLSVGGWWLWNLALSGFYDKNNPIYNVNHGITERFGRNPLWWLTLVLGVMSVVLFEMVTKILKGWFKPSDAEVFQALEKDIEVRKRFEESAAHLLQNGWAGTGRKSSLDLRREANEQAEREAHVQTLLKKPRNLDGTNSSASIRQRCSSSDEGQENVSTIAAKSDKQGGLRRSVEISELFSLGYGKVKKGEELR